LSLGLTLRLRNQAELQSLLRDLYDPGSPEYRHFLTVQEFTERFGPTVDDYARAAGFAEAYGLTVTHTAPNRLVLDVSGTVADVERAFQVTMQVYQHPTEPRTYYAPDGEPSVDAGTPVQGVSGLSTFSPPRPAGLRRVARDESVRTSWTGTGPGGTFLGSDIRAAYLPGVTLQGNGQAIGLLEFGPYNLSDVQAYFSTTAEPLNVPIVNVLLNGVDGVCGSGCDDLEEAIDIEQPISMDPNLAAVIVYEGSSDVDIFNQMAVDNVAKQLSSSWGWLPADPWADEPIFEEFAAQGQNLFVASGDSGAYGKRSSDVYPADDAYVTSVGGTDLTTASAGGAWKSETAWSDSGGGISVDNIAIPSYQMAAGVVTTANKGSKTLRNAPDVAAEANTDNYICYDGTCAGGWGGTSFAAPRWAAFVALANQQSVSLNLGTLGFINPMLYTIGLGSSYSTAFHDITSGSNGTYSTQVGYDLVTGWGSPNGTGLINLLAP
jgi:subtilase family serine protease